MGARVIDGRGLAAELKEGLAAEVAGQRDTGVVPGLRPCWSARLPRRRSRREGCTRWLWRTWVPLRLRKAPPRRRGGGGYRYRREAEGGSSCIRDPRLEAAARPRLRGGRGPGARPTQGHRGGPSGESGAAGTRTSPLRAVPSTPVAAFHMLDCYLVGSDRDPTEFYSRSNAVFVGRSNNVGKPAVSLGFSRNATVISCDERAYNAGRLAEFTTQADILIVAAGVPGLIRNEHVREGVIAIDIGINPVQDPRIGKQGFVGDLDFSGVATRAEALSPVPGGVGPITDVWLLKNTANAARISTRAEAARRSLETATTDGIVETDTISARSAREERIIR
jgi:methylenetetrahydrofolate dehydrogenase (NADP+) / methenyltetrahydrofolate cyclohydrolase